MAGDKPSGGDENVKYASSPFRPYVEGNTDRSPKEFYGVGVYVTLYNRIKGDLMNKKGGDSTAFDTEINAIIKQILSGRGADPKNPLPPDPANTRKVLKDWGYDSMVHIYDEPYPTDSASEKAFNSSHKSDFNFEVSAQYLAQDHNFNNVVGLARRLAAVKYGGAEGKPKRMLSYDDAREILKIKEEKSDKNHYMAARSLVSSIGDFNAKGELVGGPLTKAMLKCKEKIKGMKANLWRGRAKALGWTALTGGSGALAGTIGWSALQLGGKAMTGLFGTLFTASGAGGALVGVALTAFLGTVAVKSFGALISRLGQNWKDRKKLKDFMHSRGKYAEAEEGQWDKMGYKRVKQRYDEFKSIKLFYDNYQKGSAVDPKRRYKNKDGSWKPEAYVPKSYKKAFFRFIKRQEDVIGPDGGARDLKTIFNNAKLHRFVNEKSMKPGEVSYGNLYRCMANHVEDYETSSLSPDEVIMNYGDAEPQNRLHGDRIKEHKNQPDELSYLSSNLNEFISQEQSFNDAHLQAEYNRGLTLFRDKFVDSFNTSLFENAYTPSIISNAEHVIDSESFKKMIDSTSSQAVQTQMKGVVNFLAAERDYNERPVKILSEKVGVGIEHQIDMSESSIVKGCESLGDTTAEAQAAAAAIAAMDTCSVELSGSSVVRKADPAVEAAIASVADSKTKQYLEHMLDVKLSSGKVSGDTYTATLSGSDKTTAEAFTARIYAMGSTKSAETIRIQIASSSLSPAIKANLNAILDNQVVGIETAARDEARLRAIKGIKKGSVKFSELVEEIDKIESFKKKDLHSLWIKIEKIDDPNLYDYLVLRFRDKVTHELIEFAKDTTNFAGDAEAQITAIKTFINDMKSLYSEKGHDSFIDKWQFDECMKALNDQITYTMESYLRTMELDFLQDTDKKKRALGDLVKLDAPNGIANYFKLQTPESQAIYNRANRFVMSANVYEFMTVASVGGYVGLRDTESGDIQTALGVYFSKDRKSTDNLLNTFEKFNHNINQLDFNQEIDFISAMPARTGVISLEINKGDGTMVPFDYPAFGDLSTCKRIMNHGGSYSLKLSDPKYSYIMSTINTLQSDSFRNATPEERLAALTVLKRKIAGMIRVQMVQLYQKKGSGSANYTDFYNTNRTDLNNNLINGWKELAQLVDELISTSKSMLPPGSTVGSTIEPNTVSIVNSVCQPSNYSTIVAQQTMMGS